MNDNGAGPGPGSYWSAGPLGRGLRRFGPGGAWPGADWRPPAWRVVFSGIWLVYLVPMVAGAFGHRHGVVYESLAVGLAAAFGVVYVAVVGWWDRGAWFTTPGLVALFALAYAASLGFGAGATALWIYVSVAAGLAIGRQWLAVRAIGVVVVSYAAFTLGGHEAAGDFLNVLLPTVFGGLAALGVRARIEVTRELMRARETVALLAASEERLRLARDMHDLTGQSLSMITLKSELAARLLARMGGGPGQDRVRDEILQVAAVSRQTLRDIREAIGGYRRPTLAVEAITARSALEAAGLTVHDDPDLTLLSGTFDPDAEAALAWCLREAATNVVRHSGGRNCWLMLRRSGDDLSLQVRDDGQGAKVAAHGLGEGAGPAGHVGLHGMSERLRAVSGWLEIRPGDGQAADQGFCVVATVPVGERATVAV
jgi:two-component system, NarL family, sensor histidine kinase DesK